MNTLSLRQYEKITLHKLSVEQTNAVMRWGGDVARMGATRGTVVARYMVYVTARGEWKMEKARGQDFFFDL
jgi:hypothetical protein